MTDQSSTPPNNHLIDIFTADTLAKVCCTLDAVDAAFHELIRDDDERFGLHLSILGCQQALRYEADRVHPTQTAGGRSKAVQSAPSESEEAVCALERANDLVDLAIARFEGNPGDLPADHEVFARQVVGVLYSLSHELEHVASAVNPARAEEATHV